MWLDNPFKTLVVANLALIAGALIVTLGLTVLNWAV